MRLATDNTHSEVDLYRTDPQHPSPKGVSYFVSMPVYNIVKVRLEIYSVTQQRTLREKHTYIFLSDQGDVDLTSNILYFNRPI